MVEQLYTKCPHMSCSFQTNAVSERECDACLQPQLTNHILCTAQTRKLDMSGSRAVVQFVEHPYTTCSFRDMSVSRHKIWHIEKRL